MQLARETRCVIIGLGASGLAAVRFLHGLGLHVSVSESRSEDQLGAAILREMKDLGVAMETGGHSHGFFRDAALVVPSPGVPLDLPVIRQAVEAGAVIGGELALAAGRISSPVIAVTGSNGKTTVTSLIGHLLAAGRQNVFVGGNIGTPVLDYCRGGQGAQVLVLELSSFQLEIGGEFRPDIGLLINLSPDHIDRHGSLEQYAAAKRRIFRHQRNEDVAIIGRDDELVMQEKITTAGRVLDFGIHPSSAAVVEEKGVLVRRGTFGQEADEFYDLSGTALSSLVNRLNSAAAILAVRSYGCSPEAIRIGLADYVPPAHRMALVAEIDGVKYVDDSKGTNTGAVAAALASSGDRVVLIAGGRDKGSDFSLLASHVRKHVRRLILIGEAAERMEKQLGALAPVVRAANMEEAVSKAAEIATPGDTVLLSPGCASFDMFTGYAHRGEVFQQAVRDLGKISHDCC
ncbi:MAG: UDP-N-acetylmuramoyl-L-alanine--D-glutamate ligase [Desulfobulbaceae bacterium]|nr:UDP-N-acetylmuramoyl-L-alanine--D-glutamate ligase [Desulfobulbaceae bacterium]